MNYTDFIILLIIVIIIIAIVVVNINSIIDKRLSNVSVNIPPINIPPPQVTVKVQKSCTNGQSSQGINADDEYTIYVDKANEGQPAQKVMLSPNSVNSVDSTGSVNSTNNGSGNTNVEHFGMSDINTAVANVVNNTTNAVNTVNNIANSAIIGVANTVQQNVISNGVVTTTATAALPRITISAPKSETPVIALPQSGLKVYPKYTAPLDTNQNNIAFPDDSEIVEYGDYKCVKRTGTTQVISAETPKKTTCQNKSLDDMRKDTYGYMIANSKKINDIKFPTCSNYERNLIGDNTNDTDEIDLVDLYRQNQVFVKAYLEDPVVRGYNMDAYGGYSPLFKSGKISLEKEVINPKPNGYIFKSSVAYDR